MRRVPLVSAIMIFLNAAKFIQEAIDSVFAQTYHNWELLLVDDGSTDGSTNIALGYAERYPRRVRYLEHNGHQNRGKSAARNLGIRNATGEYIAFLDADDVWLPHKLEEQVPILCSQPEAAMLFGRTQIWYSWTGNPEDIKHDYMNEFAVQPDTLIRPPTLLTLFLQSETHLPCTCSILLRRAIVERIGGFEEDFRDAYEDMVFHAKVCLEEPVFVATGCWDRYRQHANSSCAVAIETGRLHPSKPNSQREAYLNWLSSYLSQKGFRDGEVWQALQKEFWPYHHPILNALAGRGETLVRQMTGLLKQIARRILPAPVHRWLKAKWRQVICARKNWTIVTQIMGSQSRSGR